MDNDNRQCNKCGLRPQQPAKPKVCGCKPKRCCKKDCCNDNEFAFRKVVIPSALGDDVTGQAKPENGNYTNSYVEYEINGAQYMYDSFGVYTKMEGGKGGGVSDFNDLDNRPKYAGAVMTGETDIPDVDGLYSVGTVYSSTSSTAPTIAGGIWTEIGTQTIGSSTVHYYERTA